MSGIWTGGCGSSCWSSARKGSRSAAAESDASPEAALSSSADVEGGLDDELIDEDDMTQGCEVGYIHFERYE